MSIPEPYDGLEWDIRGSLDLTIDGKSPFKWATPSPSLPKKLSEAFEEVPLIIAFIELMQGTQALVNRVKVVTIALPESYIYFTIELAQTYVLISSGKIKTHSPYAEIHQPIWFREQVHINDFLGEVHRTVEAFHEELLKMNSQLRTLPVIKRMEELLGFLKSSIPELK